MRPPWSRHRYLNKRVADARRRADSATAEAETSRQRARNIKETVVKPLRQRADDNRFAELIRQTLIIGPDEGGEKT